MFTSLKSALRPVLSNMLTGATFAAGGAIGIALVKGAGNLISKGAESVANKADELKAKRQVQRKVEVEVQPAA